MPLFFSQLATAGTIEMIVDQEGSLEAVAEIFPLPTEGVAAAIGKYFFYFILLFQLFEILIENFFP